MAVNFKVTTKMMAIFDNSNQMLILTIKAHSFENRITPWIMFVITMFTDFEIPSFVESLHSGGNINAAFVYKSY